MSLLVVDRYRDPLIPSPTSGSGALQWARELVISVSGALGVPGTSADEVRRSLPIGVASAEQTNSGCASSTEHASSDAAINELRRRSGLTWEQLARIFGVARRSVHFWASGKPMNAANEERLGRLLALVRYIDRGTARETRMALVTAFPDGGIPFDLLTSDAFDEVAERLGPGIASARPTLSPLSFSAKVARTTASPGELVGARHDTVHQEARRSRAGRSVRAKSERDGETR